ncbi:MAG: heat-inducible transcription repressor HrcA [Candidatus Riflebacteria bacterium]|nr:heat-inducible transcription repressor HrcA [Candidatus Riflebacteria bacterium]
MHQLSERQLQILNLAVRLFIETAEPVSSRTLVRRFRLPYSPATIRNEMADLEDLGYLVQPHTSAGRVPTDKGYNVYVASLRDQNWQPEERAKVEAMERECLSSCKEADEILKDAISILTVVTRLVGVVACPTPAQRTLTKMQLTAVDGRQVLVVLVMDGCHVEAHLAPLDRPVPQDRLDLCANMINERFAGRPVSDFHEGVFLVAHQFESAYRATVQHALQAFLQKIERAMERDVLVSGATSVLAQPEFQDFGRVRAILDAFQDKRFLARMLTAAETSGIQITFFGSPNEPEAQALKDFSLVTSVYRSHGVVRGTIGILGPRRMDYPRILTYVNHVSDSLTRVLSDK